jgi:hypothetical protein
MHAALLDLSDHRRLDFDARLQARVDTDAVRVVDQRPCRDQNRLLSQRSWQNVTVFHSVTAIP